MLGHANILVKINMGSFGSCKRYILTWIFYVIADEMERFKLYQNNLSNAHFHVLEKLMSTLCSFKNFK